MSGTATPLNPALAENQERAAQARAAGFGWDEINQEKGLRHQAAIDAGFSPDEIARAQGATNPAALDATMTTRAGNELPAQKPADNMFDAFKAGIEGSSAGLMARGALPDYILPTDAGFASRIAMKAGMLIGDVPAMIVGGMGGAAAGGAAGSAVPVVGTTIGALAGGGAGAFALPEAIRSEYNDALMNGSVTGPRDFAERQAAVLWNTTKAAVVGAVLGPAGKVAGALAEGFGAGVMGQMVAKTSGELATMTGVGSALEGHLPTMEDLTDNAILLVGAHVAGQGGSAVKTATANLAKHWAETGESPTAATARAANDPVLKQDLALPRPPEPGFKAQGPGDVPGQPFQVPTMTVEEQGISPKPTFGQIAAGGNLPGLVERIMPDGTKLPAPDAVAPYLQEFGEKAGFGFVVGPVEVENAAGDFPDGSQRGPGHQSMIFNGRGGEPKGLIQKSIVYMPATAEEAMRRWYGLGSYEVLYHEVGHALADHVLNDHMSLAITAPPDTPTGKLLQAEMLTASKNFRPKLWERNPEYNMKPTELLADSIASWISDPTMRQRMPEFTKAYGDKLQPYVDLADKYLPTRIEPKTNPDGTPNERAGETANEWSPPKEGRGAGIGGPPRPPEPPAIEGPGEGPKRIEGPPPDPWEVVNSRFAPQGVEPGWWERAKAAGGRLYRELFQPDHPLTKMQDVAEQGGPLPDMQNPRMLRRVAELSDTTSQYMIEKAMVDFNGNKIGPSLNEIMAPFSKETPTGKNQTFLTYALARIAVAEFERTNFPDAMRRARPNAPPEIVSGGPGPDFNPTSPGVAAGRVTGVDYQAAKAVVEAGHSAYDETFGKLTTWRNDTLAYARDGGLIDSATYERLVKDEATGLPLYRREDTIAEHALPNRGEGRTGGPATNARTGSELQIEDFVGSLMRDAFRRVRLANNNLANQALMDMAEGTGHAVRLESATPLKLTDVEAAEMGKDLGGAKDDINQPMAAVAERKLGWTFKADEVPVYRDGQVEKWRVFDPDAAAFIKGFDHQTMSTWQRMLVPFARFSRASTVLNPLFPVRLMLYDVPWQFITKPGMRNTLADFMVGLRHTTGDTETYDAWMRSGGAERAFDFAGKDAYIKDMLANRGDPSFTDGVWNAVKTASGYNALQAWGGMMTQAIRVGRFARGVESGESDMRAGVMSSESAFHRAGFGGPAAKNINSVQPFFLAHLNGLEQTARSQFGIGKTIGGDEFSAWQFTAKAAAMVTLPMLGNWLYNKDEDWYKAAPEWQKDNGLLINVGAKNDPTVMFIPMPPLLGLLYGGMPRRLLERFVGDNPGATKGLFGSIGASLAPPAGTLLYSAFTPLMEHFFNKSFFTGRPIVSDSQKEMLPAEQFTPWSTATSKSLSKFFTNIVGERGAMGPTQIDHLIQGYGGTLGIGGVRAAEAALKAAGVIKDNGPAPKMSDWPLLSSWMERYPSASNAPMLEFQDRMKGIAETHNSMSAAVAAGDSGRFNELAIANPAAAVLHQFRSKTPPPANVNEFKEGYQNATQAALGNKPDLMKVEMVDRALTQLHAITKFIGALPNEEPLTQAQQRALGQSLGMIQDQPPNPPGRISANDKRQLLDMAYTTMQKISETGLKSMNAAHIP